MRSRFWRTPLWLLLLSAAAARAEEPNPFLQQAKRFYEQVKYEKCAQRLEQAVQWKSTPSELVEIELYAGLCALNLNGTQDAREHFELALRLDPHATLPPYSPPKAVVMFRSISAKVAKAREREAPPQVAVAKAPEPEPAPQPESAPTETAAPAPAPEPVAAVEPEPEHRDEPAEVPDAPRRRELTPSAELTHEEPLLPRKAPRPITKLTLALGGTSVATATIGTFLMFSAQSLATAANEEQFEQPRKELQDRVRTTAGVGYACYGVAVTAAAGALISYLLTPEPRSF